MLAYGVTYALLQPDSEGSGYQRLNLSSGHITDSRSHLIGRATNTDSFLILINGLLSYCKVIGSTKSGEIAIKRRGLRLKLLVSLRMCKKGTIKASFIGANAQFQLPFWYPQAS